MSDRDGKFAGDDPYALMRRWLEDASASEPNDPDAMSLATVDPEGLPNVRIVLLKAIDDDGLVFFTNYESRKGREIEAAGKAAVVLHWKSLRRQLRARGTVERLPAERSDAYYHSRALQSRLGAWASRQSEPLASRGALMAEVAKVTLSRGPNPPRPPHWGGYKLRASEIEFWADGDFRLHDRFRWSRDGAEGSWTVTRLNP
ncbi:pyridoxamine 5'-phosphate oxidase [Mangrovicoccus algicola]|uniref:Pyridoxine/pyridoxamine 5'-phosphate oxidase n=1 Tax=Mangrovicoccus algicola TaxID=2771008 RepID=A0A8J6YYN0_9RHOB|nr:pyridoxamine 5'-phosphate oxidase [Mangrovicoccus algicola]MBE3640382.1 pyridoxamine 5'-phosphate oxidase [Mangrovicoccus algicola]